MGCMTVVVVVGRGGDWQWWWWWSAPFRRRWCGEVVVVAVCSCLGAAGFGGFCFCPGKPERVEYVDTLC
jgi:hypothetical protein